MMHRLRLSALLLVSLVAGVLSQQRDPDQFDVSQFADAEALAICRSDLLEIDENDDMRLDHEEYAAFLQLQTGNQMTGDFKDLPLRLSSIFFLSACWCDIVDPRDNECCLNGNDHIPLDTTQSPLIQPYLNFFCTNVQEGLQEEGLSHAMTSQPSAMPTEMQTTRPSDSPSFVPSDFPSTVPSYAPSDFPSTLPTLEPTAIPSVSPSMNPTISPTRFPSIIPTPFPSDLPSTVPSVFPSDLPSSTPSATPSEFPSVVPTDSPVAAPTEFPTEAPVELPTTNSPTVQPPPTLCVDFQYVVRNQVGLDAEDIINEDNNGVLQGLIAATRNITIDILNGTYPPERRLLGKEETSFMDMNQGSNHQVRNYGPSDQLVERAAIDILGSVSHTRKLLSQSAPNSYTTTSVSMYSLRGKLRHRQLHFHRRLAFYTDDIPVRINTVNDNPLCAGQPQNPNIRCAIVASTVCIVLEEDDDPSDVRALMIAGLRQAVDSGDFLRRIPPDSLTIGS